MIQPLLPFSQQTATDMLSLIDGYFILAPKLLFQNDFLSLSLTLFHWHFFRGCWYVVGAAWGLGLLDMISNELSTAPISQVWSWRWGVALLPLLASVDLQIYVYHRVCLKVDEFVEDGNADLFCILYFVFCLCFYKIKIIVHKTCHRRMPRPCSPLLSVECSVCVWTLSCQ